MGEGRYVLYDILIYSVGVSVGRGGVCSHSYSHSHEEADTQIPLVMNHSLTEDKYKHFDVYSPDTDVLIQLMDLVSN